MTTKYGVPFGTPFVLPILFCAKRKKSKITQYLYKIRLVLYNLIMRLILASNSPRRKELLSKLNYSFDVIPAACEEKSYSSAPLEIVKELACRKALDVYGRNREATVIGCDTVVDLDGEALGKPHSKREACEMLSRLSGRAHMVHTGVCIVSLSWRTSVCRHVRSGVLRA